MWSRDGSSTWAMYLSTSTSTLNFVKSKYKSKYSSKKFKYNTKYFDNFSQVQSSTLNATFMFHNSEGQKHKSSSILYLFII